MTRRDWFRLAAGAAGGAQIADLLLGSVARASAIEPAAGSGYLDAEHVVILMQENRSFDHCFGRLRGVRGFNDPRAVTLPDGKPVWLQTNAAGETYAPFRLNFKETRATWLGSLPHSWTDQSDARNHGNHDGWLDAKPSNKPECAGMPFTMGYYEREDLPFYYALADAFTICDQHFCSSLTGTTPNRLFLWTGTVRESGGAAPCVRNSEVDYNAWARWKTFPERLEDAGVSWKIYQNEVSIQTGLDKDQEAWLSNFTDNPIEFFEQYHIGIAENHRREMERLLAALPAEIEQLQQQPSSRIRDRDLARKQEVFRYANELRARWTPEALLELSPETMKLHHKAFTTNAGDPAYRELETLRYRDGDVERVMLIPKGDVLHQFRADVEKGQLPSVSWLVAPENFSDHPGAPWYGAWYVAETLDILTRNPEVWKKTIFVLTYDENDGYFDHVPPFVVPDPRDAETGKTSPGLGAEAEYLTLEQDRTRAANARGGPIGLGYRVPLIVASPWSRGGYVCSQVFDHTSVLRLLKNVVSRRTGKQIRETNISAWRREISGDLSAVFRDAGEGAQAPLPFPGKAEFLETVHRAQFQPMPSGYREISKEEAARDAWRTRQEPGVRPSTALPYQLHVDGRLSDDRARFELVFTSLAAGAPFHAYTKASYRKQPRLRTRAYAVAAGDSLHDSWALDGFESGGYDIHICGPNGFYRAFAGNEDDPRVEVSLVYVLPEGGVELRAVSRGAAHVLRVTDNAYGAVAHSVELTDRGVVRVPFQLDGSHHWYDLSLTIENNASYSRRFAGRVETGREGFSDPAMA
jgi:phospholipase C